MRKAKCSYCGVALGGARLTVNDIKSPFESLRGVYCVDKGCLEAAHAAKSKLSVARLHADLETVCEVE